ncbi:MAG: ParB/Srx family N-terminal domain-containing protein [Candidatus Korobacteraceae bacterium]
MSQIVTVSPAALSADNKNPRIADEGLGQRDVLLSIAKAADGEIAKLAADIVQYQSLDPSALPIVIKAVEPDRYIVLEGNRRLTALRALETPSMFEGAFSSSVYDEIRKISAVYQGAPITEINCCLMPTRESAEHWIDLRHTGKNGGAGLVEWGPHEKARRVLRRTGKIQAHVALLDFLENGGHLTAAERRQVPLSSFERLVKNPAVRQRIGVSTDGLGNMHFLNEEVAIKGLLYIARDLASGAKKTADIYTSDMRTKYANEMPVKAVPLPSSKTGKPGLLVSATGGMPVPQRTALARLKKDRDTLMPSGTRLRVLEPRTRKIWEEMQGLRLSDNPNALAVLLRVFLELSVDYYLLHTLKKPKGYLNQKGVTLGVKLTETVTDLESKNKISRQEAAPVKVAAQKNSFLAVSVLTLNDYIHNALMIPTPTDLRAAWDGFDAFLKALWP